jgi:proline iminopeptidase
MKWFASLLILSSTIFASPQMPRMLIHTVETQDAKLFCQVVGKGSPVIIIHGGPGLSQDYLLPNMAELSKNHQLIFYDQRACGRSEGNPKDAAIDLFVEDLEAVRKSFPFKKVSLLGHSWGGLLAIKYALTYPDAIDKLILMNCFPPSQDEVEIFIQEYIKRLSPQFEELGKIEKSEKYLAGDPETVAEHMRIIFRKYCAREQDADLLSFITPAAANVSGAIVNETIRENLFSHPFKFEVGQLKCKTLIVHGDKDVMPVSLAKSLHQRIPGSRLEVIEECGHFPFVEKPEELFSILETFL